MLIAAIQNTNQKRSEMAFMREFQMRFGVKQILVETAESGCRPDSNVDTVVV